jgi:hypothetical protein
LTTTHMDRNTLHTSDATTCIAACGCLSEAGNGTDKALYKSLVSLLGVHGEARSKGVAVDGT